MVRRRRLMYEDTAAVENLVAETRQSARPLHSAGDLDPLMSRIGDARVVLLGEASHGTHEYYTWRAEISKRLITEKGFNFIAVEGDWPDCYQVNRFVKGYSGVSTDPYGALDSFRRWPTWMWANEEVLDLIGWMRKANDGKPTDRKAGFYGLDVYSLWDSLYAVMDYLKKNAPDALAEAKRALRCFQPYGEDAQEYARATYLVPTSCEDEVVGLLQRLRTDAKATNGDGRDSHFVAEQNALVVKNAEAYYRAMVRSDSGSWNIRDRHMAETLSRLLDHHGPASKAIVWEHNTHVGDARYTDMADDGMVNIGQLAREKYGESDAVLVGFGSHRGRVIAGEEWGAPWQEMIVPPGREGSWEDILHRAGPQNKLLIFDRPASAEMTEWRGNRAIGVVYRPQYEAFGNYVPTIMPRRYDAFLFIDQTNALRPLFLVPNETEEMPETYPTGQ